MKKRKSPSPFYSLPNKPYFDVHFWADWVELVCIGNIDETVDRSSIVKRVRAHQSDLGEGGGPDDETQDSHAEINDKWSGRVEEWFAHLEMRSSRLGLAYPFDVSSSANVIRLRQSLHAAQRLYLLLLMAASLRYFPSAQSDITSSFELVSVEALRRLLPQGAEVHVFGANKLKVGRFNGDLWTNICGLAKDLVEQVLAKQSDIPDNDYGDNGLDVVGWLKIEDDLPGHLAILGQCACTEEWDGKQASSSVPHWANAMTFKTHPLNSVFVPLCLRNRSAQWHRPLDMHTTTLMIDRFRLLALLKMNTDALTDLPAFRSVDELLARKEPHV